MPLIASVRMFSAVLISALLVVPTSGRTFGQAGRPQPPPATAPAEAGDGVSFALTGDSIITRKLSVYREPAFLDLIGLIRGADAAFTNLEMLFHDYEPYPMTQSGGTYMRAEPALAWELVWAGFDMVARANNHTGDYGELGMTLTSRHVEKAGLVQAGVGNSLAEAREAAFLDTARGRVALVSVASTFPDNSRAGRSRGDMPARPGLNPLRFTTTYVLPRAQLEALRGAAKGLGGRVPDSGDAFGAFGARFALGDAPEVRRIALEEDVNAIAAVVRNASRQADYTILSFHTHESDGVRTVPPAFIVSFCHAMVDAGADMLVGSGPHVLRGVEIYKGKPILYSLGDFIFQNETLLRLPSENYDPLGLATDAHVADFNDRRYSNDTRGFPSDREIWESVVAVARWKGRTLAGLTLHPVTLQFGKGRTVRGRPLLAGPELGGKIIGDLSERSKPFGTTIAFEKGVGRVVLREGGVL